MILCRNCDFKNGINNFSQEDDFNNLQEFNDYLEEIETIVYNLCNNIDIINTNKKIEQYKKENRDVIIKNKSRIGREEFELEEMLELEKKLEEDRQKELDSIEIEAKKKKIREKEALIDELMASYDDPSKILSEYAEKAEQIREEAKQLPPPVPSATQFSTGIKFGARNAMGFLPVPKVEEGPLYVYTPLTVSFDGPNPPDATEIETKGYIQHIRGENASEKAAGYKSNIACLRALQEALQGLYQNG